MTEGAEVASRRTAVARMGPVLDLLYGASSGGVVVVTVVVAVDVDVDVDVDTVAATCRAPLRGH